MVKREDIKQGNVVKVVKEMPGSGRPGQTFTGKLGLHERLDILGAPFSRGGLNLVKVRRRKTGESVDLMYAYVTVFCRLANDEKEAVSPETPPKKPGE